MSRWGYSGSLFVCLILGACAGQQSGPAKTPAAKASLDADGCTPAKIVEFTPQKGGKVQLGAVSIEAKTGDLAKPVSLELALCPGAKRPGPKAIETTPVEALPPVRIRFADKKKHGALPVVAGRQLRYCVDASKLAPETANALVVLHDRRAAPPHPDTLRSEADFLSNQGLQCFGLDHLSFLSHHRHRFHVHVPNPVKKIKKDVHKAKNAVEKVAKDAKEDAEKLAKDTKKLAKGAENVREAVVKEEKKLGKKAWEQLKKLANPCYDCKLAVGQAVSAATCGNKSAKAKMTTECLLRLDAEFPGLLEFTPAVCAGITAGVSFLCKELVKHSKLGSLEDKLKSWVCTKVKLCKK